MVSVRTRLSLTHIWLIVFAIGAGAVGGRALAALIGHGHLDHWTGSRYVATHDVAAGQTLTEDDLHRVLYVLHPDAPAADDAVSGDTPDRAFGRTLAHPLARGSTLRHSHFRP